ncbi:hypothetical protein [Allocoleopsis sp.]|uniref:hypothetical protein n=1 Tax=Allocoleopsis sp. TaxID=3088169 RepID=UPI002FD51E92
MTWIKTSSIEVPAHANQTTEVDINEWFNSNRSFLLGTPVANQLRGTAGGWVQTVAIAAEPGQDTVALLRDRLSQILQMAKGDDATSPSDSNDAQTQGDTNIMATVIPADKFESNSPFSFILRENAKPHGIEIHFPPDSTPDAGFIGRIAAAGFEKARTNPDLWYCNYSEVSMTKARGWVKACQKNGAYEIDSSVPVEQTKSRRRGKSGQSKPTSTPTPEPAPTPVVGGKLVDAIAERCCKQIAERVQEMLNTMKEELAVKPDTSELDALRAENERLRRDMERLMREHERMETTINQQKEAIEERDRTIADLNLKVANLVTAGSELVESRDRVITSLRQQLAEWGVVEAEPEAPVFDDEPEVEAPVFDDEPPVFEDDEPVADTPNFDEEVVELGEQPSPSSSDSEPDDTSAEEGFDLDSLGER